MGQLHSTAFFWVVIFDEPEFGFFGLLFVADFFPFSALCFYFQVNLDKVDYIVVSCPFDEGPMHYVDGREVPTSGSRIFKNRGRALVILLGKIWILI